MKYDIITIEREYASGGSEIGKRLSEKLGIPVYGQEILDIVARNRGTTPAQIVHMEEKTTGSYLYAIAMAAKMISGQTDGLTEENALFLEEGKVIRQLADQGNCIVVGRCSGWVLKDKKNVLKVFVYADRDTRIKRAVESYGNFPGEAENILRKYDKRRNSFYAANTGKKWDDKDEYHLMLDSGKLGIDKCVEIIVEATGI